MSKKKNRSSSKNKKPEYVSFLFGLLLVLIGLIGIGRYGIVGKIIASFSIFLVGNLYFFLILLVLVLGIIIIYKDEKINIFNSKMIGIYLMIIGILTYMHKSYIDVNLVSTSKIISNTIDSLMNAINGILNTKIATGIWDNAISNTGGGILAAIFSTLFFKAFEAEGTTIVVIVLSISGFVIFTGLSIIDIIKNIYDKSKDLVPKKQKNVEKNHIENSEEKRDFKIVDHTDTSKIVVNDIREIMNKPEVKQEVKQNNEEIKDNKKYKLPPISLLEAPKKTKSSVNHDATIKNIEVLEKVLRDFGIIGKVVEVNVGPTVVQYELELNSGTKVSKLLGINREISLALAKKDVRIQAPIPGKSTVGIEMPNDSSVIVTLRETIEGMPDDKKQKLLTVALGKNILGRVEYCAINKTPHLLVAGATGSGKSVCINTIIISILMKAKPSEVKLVLVDPKKVELGIYNGVPHLLTPVVTDPRKASIALRRAVSEMERRYDLFEETGNKNIESYNDMIDNKNKNLSDDEKITKLPYIVVIVDELADLMLVAGKEVEDSIMRITQMARAAGIHLIIATQRPSTDVITGLIKANIPSRISFAVSSQIDSRTILDMGGAEKLLGKGDMLFLPMGESAPARIQGAYVNEEEIKRVIDYTIGQQKASYDDKFLNLEEKDQEIKENTASNDYEEYDDPLYNDIVEFVITTGKASASLLQRKFKLGYNRAARIVDLLEERGIIGPQNGSKPREVLIKLENKEE